MYELSSEAVQSRVAGRSEFITKTYLHVFGAILAFAAIEVVLFELDVAKDIAIALISGGRLGWLLILGGFMAVGWLATHVAHNVRSLPLQYLALAAYVVADAIVFLPLLVLADARFPGAIQSAVLATAAGFTGLTAIAFITRKDFSFLRAIVFWGFTVAFVLVICGAIFGFQLGPIFWVAMVGLAGAAILYDTSNILHHYEEDRYVAASLQLFASVAVMFWYVLRLFTRR